MGQGFSDFADIPRGRYGVVMADPPWLFRTWSKKNQTRAPDAHYSCLPFPEIAALPVADLCLPDAVLFMWGTAPMVRQCLDVIDAWGFAFKGRAFSWAKTNPLRANGRASDPSTWFMGLGYGSRSNAEDCWLATRGRPRRIARDVRELIVAPRREHSRKPDEAFDRAGRLFPGPRIELFCRQLRPGWDGFGNQLDCFEEVI